MLKSIVKHAQLSALYSMPVGMETIGQRIRRAREAKGLGLAPIASATGISVSALSQIETDVTKWPRADNLFRIADALGVEARYLVFGHNDRSAPFITAIGLTDTGKFRVRHRHKE